MTRETESAEARLEAAKRLLATVPEGRALLALAAETFCPVLLAPPAAAGQRGKYSLASHRVHIDPALETEEMAEVLGHELLHMWQHRNAGALPGVTPGQKIAVVRVLEGGAHAFSDLLRERFRNKSASPLSAAELGAAFNRFQESGKARKYDARILAGRTGDSLRRAFNETSFAGLPDLRRLLVPGLDMAAAPYVTETESADLLKNMLDHARPQNRGPGR